MGEGAATGISEEEFARICDDCWVATGLPAAAAEVEGGGGAGGAVVAGVGGANEAAEGGDGAGSAAAAGAAGDGAVAAWGAAAMRAGRSHTGQVQITGAWAGAVTIQMSAALATIVASEMFGLEEDELEPGDVTDAVGELANVIAGNVKARLPQPSQLSLPSVTVGEGYEVSVLGSKVTAALHRRCGDEHLVLRLLEGATG